jgi:hypothetical protein
MRIDPPQRRHRRVHLLLRRQFVGGMRRSSQLSAFSFGKIINFVYS